MQEKITVLVQGASEISEVPNLDSIAGQATIRFATDRDSLAAQLPGSDVLLGWNFRANDIEHCWDHASDLKWVHWSGAGVDAALFPALRDSNVTLTNSRGVFDRAMAEWALGVMIAHAKDFPRSQDFQRSHEWNYRESTQMMGQNVLVVGVGAIGRHIARVCKAFGLNVSGLGRTARSGDDDFQVIHARSDLDSVLADADYVISIPPLTPDTEDMFGAEQFAAMKPTTQFINLGRGQLVDEAALIAALDNGTIAAAALDVFREEPLPAENPIWDAKNLFVSPHISGDFIGHSDMLSRLFLDNFELYRNEQALKNIVDKQAGFVPSDS
ncbi:MAG: D-2-hydroxyacid dehydrogenase [Rhodospirillales bacterium]|nr:D-2-hydroxyacid dehydrogenase [Rhodospirillales bacterium]MBT4041744.1 D-2-hydroxyacid dehydrogenase [Rhodospirillales bacterium]MBT4627929.1 D-2-hydroxyacid dehydrogenase [Rhodospirillales bacterium]MBT5350656.1 D-2-hydroxyacid dehydrogenase [Rhodospirillales bacterium]MBT6109196.1 D-2-hydroxyacid dehydrogenase [Rhodospirillales bacterium]